MIKVKASYLIFILMIAYCFLSTAAFSQTKSTDIRTINGKKYYIHKVEKGQSLYGIAKIYGMDVNSILVENDEAIDGLRNGQELKIPFESLLPKATTAIDTNKYQYHKILKGETVYAITKKYGIDEKKLVSYNPGLTSNLKEGEYIVVGEKKKTATGSGTKTTPTGTMTAVTPGQFDQYTVLQGETLYGISKKLNLSQDDLIKWNPELKNGIKQGQIIKIPAAKTTAVNTTSPTVVNTVQDTVVFSKPKKTSYTIGLFLPFSLPEAELINIDELARAKASFPATQNLAIDFYSGFKTAVDSLVSKDFEVNVHLFDTQDRDSVKIDGICKTTDFKNLDIIFGPLYGNSFKQVAAYAKVYNIPIVSPVIQQNKILYNNALISKVTPSLYTLIEGLADYCVDSLAASSNIIIVNTTAKDQPYIKTFKGEYNDRLLSIGKTAKDSIVEVKGIAGVKAAFVPGKKNVVVLLTNNPVYLQDFITQLYVFSDKKDIVMMGFSSVANIDNLDQEYLNKLQFHFATNDHTDLTNPLTLQLAKRYQEYFSADPSEYYFSGFDIAAYYLSNLKAQGPAFFMGLDKAKAEGVSTGFKFYRPDESTGFENKAMSIYKYSNYKLQKLGWN
jgi:LysM repeat protein